jgi:uncharacterized protein (TIGR03067 family)
MGLSLLVEFAMLPRYASLLVILLGTLPVMAQEFEEAGHYNKALAWRRSTQQQLQQLSAKELLEKFHENTLDRSPWLHDEKLDTEMLLTEMVRRGGKEMEQAIVAKMDQLQKALREQDEAERRDDKVKRKWISPENLHLLTSLRRIQQKPDPMQIDVRQLGITSTTRELPRFCVTLRNADLEKSTFHFAFGGSYRSGRLARWTFEVKDAQGRQLKPREWDTMTGGGMFSMGDLKHGETWGTELPMGNYVRVPAPGEYTVRVFYHNTLDLADCADLTGVIVCTSQPFKVTIGKPVPRTVFVRAGSNDRVAALLKQLKGQTKVKTVCSKYDQSLHSFINPTSPEGQLLQMEWNAVPGLLALLKDKSMTPEQRAWIFTMLHTLTDVREFNPFSHRGWRHRVIAAYEYRELGCSGSGGAGPIDQQAQQQLANEWLNLASELWTFVVAEDATLRDWSALEGNWKLESTTVNGEAVVVDGRCCLENGAMTEIHYGTRSSGEQKGSLITDPAIYRKGKFLIDGVKKTMDIDVTQGKDQGKSLHGLYRLEGDKLTWCFSTADQPRPTDLTSKPDSGQTVTVWTREKR